MVSGAGRPEAWTPSPHSPPAETTGTGLRFPCAFDAGVDRHYWDLEVTEDLSRSDGVTVEYGMEHPGAFRAVTLYARRGGDWYSVYLPVEAGPRRMFVPFDRLGNPEVDDLGGDLDRIRLSPWASDGGGEGALVLRGLSARRAALLLIEPGEASSPSPTERAYGGKVTDWLAEQFGHMNLPAARVSDEDLGEGGAVERFPLWVLPYNPQPSKEMLRVLEAHVERGGRLLVFYSPSESLAEVAGVKAGRYREADQPGQWTAMVFPEDWPGPKRVYQRETGHLIPVKPGDTGRIAAWWEDARGVRRPEPAVVVTDRAAWVTAVLTPEDDLAKRRMLAFLCDALVPDAGMAATAARARWEEVRARVSSGAVAADIREDMARADRLLTEGRVAEAWDVVDGAARALDLYAVETYAGDTDGMLGIWDHAGRGLYVGDWDRTARELSEAGITDMFVYAGPGAPSPGRAAVAGAKYGVRTHGWHICWKLHGVSPLEVRRYAREGRLQVGPDGEERAWFCPSVPENREMELRRLKQMASTRDLDGVHLDYIRWPDGPPCVCSSCERTFVEWVGAEVDWPEATREGPRHEAFLRWRAEVISAFVKEASEAVRTVRPGLTLSAAVWPAYPETVGRLGQDWAPWVRDGWLDFVAPMNYTGDAETFRRWLLEQVDEAGGGGRVAAGIGYTAAESRLTSAEVLRQLGAAREAGARGAVLFDLNHTFRGELLPVLRKLHTEGTQP